MILFIIMIFEVDPYEVDVYLLRPARWMLIPYVLWGKYTPLAPWTILRLHSFSRKWTLHPLDICICSRALTLLFLCITGCPRGSCFLPRGAYFAMKTLKNPFWSSRSLFYPWGATLSSWLPSQSTDTCSWGPNSLLKMLTPLEVLMPSLRRSHLLGAIFLPQSVWLWRPVYLRGISRPLYEAPLVSRSWFLPWDAP